MGLGPFPVVTKGTAKQRALEARRMLALGTDPLAARAAARDAERVAANTPNETFRVLAESYVADHAAGWRGCKTAASWRATLATYANQRLGGMSVAAITTDDVLAVLRPVWSIKTATAMQVRSRIESILDYAKARGLRSGENPAAWRGNLAHLLPPPGRVHRVKHHPALPAADMPDMLRRLGRRQGVAPGALVLIALTACRVGEMLGATWAEVDLTQNVWTIPAGRTKAGRVHSIPLSTQAVALLRTLRPTRDRIAGHGGSLGTMAIFPGVRRGRSLSASALARAWRLAGGGKTTVHGMRSTFRDWCGERGEDRQLAELSLAHKQGDATEQAYARSELLVRRRRLMQRWAAFACGSSSMEARPEALGSGRKAKSRRSATPGRP